MFHLFKRVYLELDDTIDLNNNRMVISEANGFPMMQDLDNVTYGTLFDHATSLGELVGPGKKYENFLQFLNYINQEHDKDQKRFVIYCDKAALLEIAITWIKAVLPSITMDDAYMIFASYQFQIRMFGTSDSFAYRRAYRFTQVDEFVPQSEFVSIYNRITVEPAHYIGFVNLVKSSLSLEFLLASYLYNGSCKEELKTIALNKIKFGMQQFMYECKSFILENLLNTEVISKFTPTVTYSPTNLEEVTRDGAFDVWFEPSIWDVESVAVPHATSLIHFDRLTPSQFDKIKSHLLIFWAESLLTTPEQLNESASAWVDVRYDILGMCRQASLSDADLNKLLTNESGSGTHSTDFSIFEATEKSKYNIYMLEHVKQLYTTNRKERLKSFVLQ